MPNLMDEIYASVLVEMAANNIEDTLENRIVFLKAVSDAWAEDETTSVEQAMYKLALSTEIVVLINKLEATLK